LDCIARLALRSRKERKRKKKKKKGGKEEKEKETLAIIGLHFYAVPMINPFQRRLRQTMKKCS
jgi:hypothetical protein